MKTGVLESNCEQGFLDPCTGGGSKGYERTSTRTSMVRTDGDGGRDSKSGRSEKTFTRTSIDGDGGGDSELGIMRRSPWGMDD